MSKTYSASRPVSADTPEDVAAAVRAATEELRDTLRRQGIESSFEDIALLGHSESFDNEGQRWVHVEWDGPEAG
ncbi:hypothetical protein ACFVTM_22245 [Arthrobacter sp. NPDC058130]|uniref:hypothetical protein n=1 Tax=Arthrobacter sp. NPDC058130 TaxID=3346353 RepID=UPI0036E3A91B